MVGYKATTRTTPTRRAAIIGPPTDMSKPPATNTPPNDKPPRIIIAGWGLMTPLGLGAWATFSSLLKGRTLSDRASELPEDTAPVDLARALGSVVSVQHSSADPAVELAERAVREAATMAGVSPAGLPLWLGTSKGAIAKVSNQLGLGRPLTDEIASCLAMGPHAYLSQQLTRRLHTQAKPHYVAACSSGLFALDAARQSLLNSADNGPNASPYALVASADAAITPALVYSYLRLGVLGNMTRDTYTQRPLDARRQGFMLSEMGAAVLLKRLAPDEQVPENAIELVDTVTACEPYDIIRSPSEMTSLAHLWHRLTADRSIDVIHPHAPGTLEHDPAELGVLLPPPSPNGSPPPDLYAVKGAIGHSLGASGLASLVVAALSLRSGKRPPMPWLKEPMQLPDGSQLQANPAMRPCNQSGTHAVLAAGFGGHLAAAVLQGNSRSKAPPAPTQKPPA
ncbi:MAG: beta-ketoacyl synthase N-terminal-like domain-containing protein [Phycisphaeraceae bacterium]